MERFSLSCWAALLPNSLQIFKLLFGIISVRLRGEAVCFPWETATQDSQALLESQPLANLNFSGLLCSQLLFLVLPASQAGRHRSLRYDFFFRLCFEILPTAACKICADMVYCRFCELMNKQEENNTGSNGKAQSGLRWRCWMKRPHGKWKRRINIAIIWVYLYYWDFFTVLFIHVPYQTCYPVLHNLPSERPKGTGGVPATSAERP